MDHDKPPQGEATTLRQSLRYLRENERILAAPSGRSNDYPIARMARTHERFLARERGLTCATVITYLPTVHAFLTNAGAIIVNHSIRGCNQAVPVNTAVIMTNQPIKKLRTRLFVP